jgi:hypothetical protein
MAAAMLPSSEIATECAGVTPAVGTGMSCSGELQPVPFHQEAITFGPAEPGPDSPITTCPSSLIAAAGQGICMPVAKTCSGPDQEPLTYRLVITA